MMGPPPPVPPPPPGQGWPPPPPQATRGRGRWVLVGLVAFAVAGLAFGAANANPGPSDQAAGPVTIDPDLPFEGLAVELDQFCPDVQAVRQSLLVFMPDGDDRCRAVIADVLPSLGFSEADLEAELSGDGEARSGRMKLTLLRVNDGWIVGVDVLSE